MTEITEKKALDLLAEAQIIVLTAVDEAGYPYSGVMTKLSNKGLSAFYFVAGKSSRKVMLFEKNPKASICYYSPGGSVTLIGKVTSITDRNILEALWQERLRHSFPLGVDDPNFCILEFIAENATLCFSGKVEHHSM